MKWLDRGVLLLFCCFSLWGGEIDVPQVAAILLAVAAVCLLSIWGGLWPRLAAGVFWLVASGVYPVFFMFWPVLAYELVFEAHPLVWLPPAAGLVLLLARPAGVGVFRLAACMAVGLLLGLHQRREDRMATQSRQARDQARELSLHLEIDNRKLAASANMEAHLATLHERGRIAREIHDSVGHILARSLMQTGALMVANADPAVACGLNSLRETLNAAMNSMRESVHNLRDDSLDLYAMIGESLADFKHYTVNLNYDFSPGAPWKVKHCFAAIIGEALANTARHSNGSAIHLDVLEHPGFYLLSYSDNGKGQAGTQGGIGLDNMAERVQALGGFFSLNKEKGFSIHISIPKEGSSHDLIAGR